MALMAAARIDSPDLTFEDHQSVDATLSDYEEQERHFPDMPSQHSGFRSDNESEVDDQSRRWCAVVAAGLQDEECRCKWVVQTRSIWKIQLAPIAISIAVEADKS